eukprot:CAMPEP_0204321984 /NCGR_PEP_ID=MMETSP0469-20131031/8447_1 /ASSEMBLY_ACC=CAM_ASM_000384 /TAXON_ID=2969 /ORGANISM="Oxyrrhis marina" /LENGTH=972 /DNA_ID=CAMNT_0051303307 /DNA_START=35 /DNA_END=2953 /DNA_ORIENTATION=-
MAARRVGYTGAVAGIVASFGILVATWLLRQSDACADVEASFAASPGLVHLACESEGRSVMGKAKHERFPGDVVLPISTEETQESLSLLAVDLLRQMVSDSVADKNYMGVLRAVNASFTFPTWSDEALLIARKLRVPFIDSTQVKAAAEKDGIIASTDDVHFAAAVVTCGHVEVGDRVALLPGIPLLHSVGSRAEANVEIVDGGAGPKAVAASKIALGSRLKYFRGTVSPLEALGRFGASDLASNVINLDPTAGVGQSVKSQVEDWLKEGCGQQLRRPTVAPSGELSAQKCREDMELLLNTSGRETKLKAWARLASECGKQLKDLKDVESSLDVLKSRSHLDRNVALAAEKQRQSLARCRSYYKKKVQAVKGEKVPSPKADVPPKAGSSSPTKEIPKIRMKDGSPFTIWKKPEIKDGPVRMVAKPPQQQPKSSEDTRMQYGEDLEDDGPAASKPTPQRAQAAEDDGQAASKPTPQRAQAAKNDGSAASKPTPQRAKAVESPLPTSSRESDPPPGPIKRDQEAILPPKPTKANSRSPKRTAASDDPGEAEKESALPPKPTRTNASPKKGNAASDGSGEVEEESILPPRPTKAKASSKKGDAASDGSGEAEEKRRVRERRRAREQRQKDQEARERLAEARAAGEDVEEVEASAKPSSSQGSIPPKAKDKRTSAAAEQDRETAKSRQTADSIREPSRPAVAPKSGQLPRRSPDDAGVEGKEGLPRKRNPEDGGKNQARGDSQPQSKEAPFPSLHGHSKPDAGKKTQKAKAESGEARVAQDQAPPQHTPQSKSQGGLPKNKESVPKRKQGRAPRKPRSASSVPAAGAASSSIPGSLRSKPAPESAGNAQSPTVSEVRASEGVMIPGNHRQPHEQPLVAHAEPLQQALQQQKAQRRQRESSIPSSSSGRPQTRQGSAFRDQGQDVFPDAVTGAVASRPRSADELSPEASTGAEETGEEFVVGLPSDSQASEGIPQKRR